MVVICDMAEGYFSQDNAPGYQGYMVMNWYQGHDSEFFLLPWPSQSPYLNPIEHLWGTVKQAVQKLSVHSSNLPLLREATLSAWGNITAERFQHSICATANCCISEGQRRSNALLDYCLWESVSYRIQKCLWIQIIIELYSNLNFRRIITAIIWTPTSAQLYTPASEQWIMLPFSLAQVQILQQLLNMCSQL